MKDTTLRNFSMMLEALEELEPEIQAAQALRPGSGQALRQGLPASQAGQALKPVPAAPSLAVSLSELGPLPREAMLLGLASDGLPVLLNLHDPYPGPLLIAADPGAGKTALLQLIAQALVDMHAPEDAQFGVVSNYPDEWGHLEGAEQCVGVFPTYHEAAVDFITSLSGWAHTNKGERQSVVLLIDDLESMNDLDFDVQQTLRWLLMRGPARRVWPVVTMNAERGAQVEGWLEAFRTRIFGQVKDERTAATLANLPGTSFRHLQAGVQFALREGSHWLKFWIPQLDDSQNT
jgi:hypothetical protein